MPPESDERRAEWDRAFFRVEREMAAAHRRTFGPAGVDEAPPWDEDEAGRESLETAAMFGLHVVT